MTNADKFKDVFGMYSEEFWAKQERDMLNWINSEYQEHQTNADRIRAMSDEELAEEIIDCVLADLFRLNVLGTRPNTKEEWLKWLKEEVEDDTRIQT